MLSKPVAQPKPASTKGRRTRVYHQLMAELIDAVWSRESDENGWAHCHECGHIVKRGSEFFGGEVHHILPRSTHPELKYEPLNSVLLCRDCHRTTHHQLTRKETQ